MYTFLYNCIKYLNGLLSLNEMRLANNSPPYMFPTDPLSLPCTPVYT